ncbi:lactate utilization protein [Azospirillum sp. TSO35-2]|uniref:LutC/YkgG family protein n=1 Tax=Azospirillum sp. TSO35-2 TaxID=716796 RepID=UPI000D60F8A5|nr:lactate utilization protein [Azospirillum sp. TSO35-2]PWC32816.1 lactate utilization protein B/C [Azospirillum sp. TSO35-2]
MPDARSAILAKLRADRDAHPLTPPASDFTPIEAKRWPDDDRLPRIRRLMEAVHTEFLDATDTDWPAVLREFLAREGVGTLLYAPETEVGKRLEREWEREGTHEVERVRGDPRCERIDPCLTPHPSHAPHGPLPSPGAGEGPTLIPYDKPIEDLKPQLFTAIDAGLTTTRGAIAETGSLILWPSADEPRTLSLVPHIHIALLRADALYDTFLQAMREQRWADAMSTNALLISGPSKTADIEQTLAYGVHGPKRLVVLVVRS